MSRRLVAMAAAHLLIMMRRRAALLALVALPLAFYGALYRHSAHAITVGGIASAFSAGGAAIFSMAPARDADRRLVLAGYRPWELLAGRLVPLWAGSLVISGVTATVMIAGTNPAHPGYVLAGVAAVGGIAVPLGLALGAVLPRELEATLVLIGCVGIQLTARTDSAVAKFLPFHAAGQLLDASTGTVTGIGSRAALTAIYGAGLLAIALGSAAQRVRTRGKIALPGGPNVRR